MAAPLRQTGIRLLLLGAFILACLFWAPRLNPLPPRNLSYLIEAGDVSRGLVTSMSRITGRAPLSIRPHHLEYTSSNGPVDVFVTRFNLTDGADAIREMEATSALVRAGGTPQNLVAQSSGVQGTIPLHWWPYGNVRYTIFLRPTATSEVTVKACYAP
ncbi:MAG TPA: hypothetical protein VNQ76_06645 [Planctomicrobium sp.]|nr:hypothetical protein [Planctomicrobium sp.]